MQKKLLCVQCDKKLTGQKRLYCSRVCQNLFFYKRKKGQREAHQEKMLGNDYGKMNKGESHAPIFKRKPSRPEMEGHIPEENLRALAATIILDAIKNIRKRKESDKESINWRRDLRWIHSQESNLWLWCSILGIPEFRIRQKIPK